jgi:outer membrane protein OmpA-like peptidoglycan-associated protein
MRVRTSLAIITTVLFVFAGCAGSPDPAPPVEDQSAEAPTPEEQTPTENESADPEPSTSEPAAPPPEEEPSPSLSEVAPNLEIRTNRGSFSPQLSDELAFRLSSSDEDAISSSQIETWSFSLQREDGTTTVVQEGSGLPPRELIWNGSVGDGEADTAGEGTYTPFFDVTFSDESSRTYQGRPFLVDTSDPVAEVRLSGVPFRPGSGRGNNELIMTIDAEDASPIVEWSFEPRTLEGDTLARFAGESDVPRTARWNGRSGGSIAVESGEEYLVFGEVRDDAGNRATTETRFVVGAITEEYRGRQRIVLPRIEFPANSSDISTASPEALRTFDRTVTRLARILANAPETRVLIEGHANSTRFTNGEPSREEQQNELIPLSRERAQVVRRALIERGIDGDRLETDGIGAADPVTAFSNRGALDRNRRIELYVIE